jgi:dTDP-4-dehydrorhamnose reductase
MIWLIGNKGMLGREVENLLKQYSLPYVATDMDVDITNFEALEAFTEDKPLSWIINCSAYTAVDKAEEEREKTFLINKNRC